MILFLISQSLKPAVNSVDCRHETEPGCAIRAAIADGTLAMIDMNCIGLCMKKADMQQR